MEWNTIQWIQLISKVNNWLKVLKIVIKKQQQKKNNTVHWIFLLFYFLQYWICAISSDVQVSSYKFRSKTYTTLQVCVCPKNDNVIQGISQSLKLTFTVSHDTRQDCWATLITSTTLIKYHPSVSEV